MGIIDAIEKSMQLRKLYRVEHEVGNGASENGL
jgi:hypothetical protein